MKLKLRLLRLNNCPILKQLQIEESLLRANDQNWAIFNHGSPPAIVMGISNKCEELIEIDQDKSLPIIRRFSGGGTVVINEETLFCTFIMNEEVLDNNRCPKKIMEWIARFYQPALDKHGFNIRENDFALGNRKFGGNAQSLIRKRWLHHSSLLWNYHEKQMECLKMPKRAPVYRQGRSHEEFLCRLKEYLHSPEELYAGIETLLYNTFTIEYACLEEILPILSLPHRKATTLL